MSDCVTGAISIRVESVSDAHSKRLIDIINSFACIQNVPHVPTQREGGTIGGRLLLSSSLKDMSDRQIDALEVAYVFRRVCNHALDSLRDKTQVGYRSVCV